jgi:hypothetical protein
LTSQNLEKLNGISIPFFFSILLYIMPNLMVSSYHWICFMYQSRIFSFLLGDNCPGFKVSNPMIWLKGLSSTVTSFNLSLWFWFFGQSMQFLCDVLHLGLWWHDLIFGFCCVQFFWLLSETMLWNSKALLQSEESAGILTILCTVMTVVIIKWSRVLRSRGLAAAFWLQKMA